jgi:hypothetical protein
MQCIPINVNNSGVAATLLEEDLGVLASEGVLSTAGCAWMPAQVKLLLRPEKLVEVDGFELPRLFANGLSRRRD